MKQEIISKLQIVAKNLGIPIASIVLEYPENPEHGDYSSNIAMTHAKSLKMAPKVLAEKIVEEFKIEMPEFVDSVSVAGPGFINFKIKDKYFAEQIVNKGTIEKSKNARKEVMVEYTDPNPFKIFHIGHLMSNAVGESISRLVEYQGNKVIRACYQGDVGLHVAKTIWGIKNEIKFDLDSVKDKDIITKVNLLGSAYVLGSRVYEENTDAGESKKEIEQINKKIFEKSDPEINEIYDLGRKWSLEYFDTIYKRLGTSFDELFFESEVAKEGIDIVNKNSKKKLFKKSVFTESDGAIVFKGEDYGLHTRVFINSQGLPTYETKELGLNTRKFEKYPELDQSVIITANEQSDYFKVVLKAFSLIDPKIYSKTKHISHGILRFASGKMSSRTGNVISAEDLINEIKTIVVERIKDREFTDGEAQEVADIIAIGAIKYTILRQAIGTDVIFDSAKSISFEGDSGPYLQYSVVRANSIVEKAKKEGVIKNDQVPMINDTIKTPEKVGQLEKLILRFDEVVDRSAREYAPQHVANYLINLAGSFNSFYAGNTIVDANEPLSAYRVALTQKFVETMSKGLHILGIKIPKRM